MKSKIGPWLLYYLLTALIFALVDIFWISKVAQPQYKSSIGHLIASEPNLAGAIPFYLIFVAGILHYGIRPLDPDASMRKRVVGAMLFGFFTYSTWALTALSILDRFPVSVAVTDILWGTFVSALVTWLTVLITRPMRRKVPVHSPPV